MPETLFIGGSNAHALKDAWGTLKKELVIETPFGRSHPIHLYEENGTEYAVLFRHGTGGYDVTASFVNYRANIFAAKKLNVRRIISWTGPGGINSRYEIGDLVIPHDILDFTKKRQYTFFENKGLGFIRMNPCFCPSIRKQLIDAVGKTGRKFHEQGVYVCTEGPRLETAAEIRFFASAGADMVGMTLVPEAFLARELEMCYASLCYITNYAEREDIGYKEGELFEGTLPEDRKALVDSAVRSIPGLFKSLLCTQDNKECVCKKSMLRYKRSGKITENFEEWMR